MPLRDFCPNEKCCIRLFPHTNYMFNRYEDAGEIRHFYVWTNDGWKHRDHFMEKIARPLTREISLPKLPANYGKHTTPGEVAKRGGVIKKQDRSKLLPTT